MNPNVFHKICPGVPKSPFSSYSESTETNNPLNYPQCGDGSAFSFYYSKPIKRKNNDHKILIEFMGGGACWDSTTCELQQDYLTFPSDKLDAFVGLSCSEIQAGADSQGQQISMLCANPNVGGVDFTTYNTIVVPYCTQDVFVGSSQGIGYDDGSTVNHVGAANTMAVLRWVYQNFPNPNHIVLTGCSAGGTAVPIAYDLLNMHYNRWTKSPPGMKSTQISVIADSAVYLTPSYFLENAFENWNPKPIMNKLRFPYSKYKSDEQYSTLVWEHVLKRGPNSDRWGFITHNDDPVSQTYFQYMSGGYDDANYNNNNNNNGRMLDNDNGDYADEWWSSLSSSISYVQERHSNVDTFVIDGQGHCTFGLYYAIQEGGSYGFDDWAQGILEERFVLGHQTHSVPLFLTAIVLGVVVTIGSIHGGRSVKGLMGLFKVKRTTPTEIDIQGDGVLLANPPSSDSEAAKATRCNMSWFSRGLKKVGNCCKSLAIAVASFFQKHFEDYPITAGYLVVVSFYFWTMILSSGFAHPVDNPSLGPTAATLSSFGINNPALIVYQSQFFRLITSGFLCSGIVTYGIAVACFMTQIRHIETAFVHLIDNTTRKHFFICFATILLGCNLVYACPSMENGATCSTIAIAVGLNVQSIFLARRYNHIPKLRQIHSSDGMSTLTTVTKPANNNPCSFPTPIRSTILVFMLVSLFFPFNNWLVMLGGAITGAIIGVFGGFPIQPPNTIDAHQPQQPIGDVIVAGKQPQQQQQQQQQQDQQTCSVGSLGSLVTQPIPPTGLTSAISDRDPSQQQLPQPQEQQGILKTRSRWPMISLWIVYLIMFILLAFRIRKPNELYQSPFLTGCELTYLELPASIAGSFYDNSDNDNQRRRELLDVRRWLNGEDEDGNNDDAYGGDSGEDMICAEFCVPHIVSKPSLWGAKMFSGYAVEKGQCEDNGYPTHIADKSFAKATYSVDVEVYSSASGY